MANLPSPVPRKPESKGIFGRVTGAVTERVVETVDPNILLEYVDVDALLERIDVNRLLDRIDVERLLSRIDLDPILANVDMNALLSGVDLEALVRRSGIPDIVAESTGMMAGSALDVARRQIVGLDFVIGRFVDRLLRRKAADHQAGPIALVGPKL